MPTAAQISMFVHWKSISEEMKLVKCEECPFELCCHNLEDKIFKSTLCIHIDHFVEIIKHAWNLPEAIKQGTK